MHVIAITGGTGSGKTTLVQSIVSKISNKEILFLSSDSYYKDNPKLSFLEREKINYDEPNAIDFNFFNQFIIVYFFLCIDNYITILFDRNNIFFVH